MNEDQIRQIVKDELALQNSQNQFGVNLSPIHTHSSTDSAGRQIPLSSIQEAIPILGTQNNGLCSNPQYDDKISCISTGPSGASASWVQGDVFSPVILGGQKVNNQYTTGVKNPQNVYTLPINVVYGNGVGIDSEFNYGYALPGTMLFFDNDTLSGLWIKTFNNWYQIPVGGVKGPTGATGARGPTGPTGP